MVSISMAVPIVSSTVKNRLPAISSDAFFKPLPVKIPKQVKTSHACGELRIAVSLKQKAVAGATAATMTASMMIPEVAQAAEGVSPSLKNFLLSITAGGVVVGVIAGAVIAVANFDPVKRV